MSTLVQYWWLIAIVLALIVVAQVALYRRVFAGAANFVHKNGTVLKVEGEVTTEEQKAAIYAYMELFSANPEDPTIEQGLRQHGFEVTYVSRARNG